MQVTYFTRTLTFTWAASTFSAFVLVLLFSYNILLRLAQSLYVLYYKTQHTYKQTRLAGYIGAVLLLHFTITTQSRMYVLLLLLLLFLTFSALVANPKKLLHTVANPARGRLNRKKKKSLAELPPPPSLRALLVRRRKRKRKITRCIHKSRRHFDYTGRLLGCVT